MTYRALQDLSHDPKLAEALGNMVIAWAHAEIVLFSAFARIAGIGLNMAMEAYHRIPTFESRVKFTLALLGEWKSAKFDKDEIEKAIEKLAKLAKTRNHWVHGDWCADDARTETVIFNHRAHINSPERRKPVKAADIVNHYSAVQQRAKHLAVLIKWKELDA